MGPFQLSLSFGLVLGGRPAENMKISKQICIENSEESSRANILVFSGPVLGGGSRPAEKMKIPKQICS